MRCIFHSRIQRTTAPLNEYVSILKVARYLYLNDIVSGGAEYLNKFSLTGYCELLSSVDIAQRKHFKLQSSPVNTIIGAVMVNLSLTMHRYVTHFGRQE